MPALPLPAGTDHDIPLALDVDGASQLASTIAGMHCHSSGWQFYPGLQVSSTTGTTPVKAHARLQPWGQPRSSSVRIPLWNPRDRAQKRLTKIQTCRSSPAIFPRSLTGAIALQILWILRNEHPRFGLKRPRRATKKPGVLARNRTPGLHSCEPSCRIQSLQVIEIPVHGSPPASSWQSNEAWHMARLLA